jgi:flagellar protein FliS
MSHSPPAQNDTVQSSPVAVVQLYDTVLLHIGRAAVAARAVDYQKQFDEVMSATRILDGLNRHLDMEKGGQVALNLRDMYESINRVLLRSIGKSTAGEACDKLVNALRNTRNAWAEICGLPQIHE